MIHRRLRRRRRGSGPFAPPAGCFVRRFGESVPQFGEFLEERFRVLPASGPHRVGVVVSRCPRFGYGFQYAGFQQEGPPVAVISRGPFIGVVGYLFGRRFDLDGGVCDDGRDVFLPGCRFGFLARRRPRRRDVLCAHACRFLYARRHPAGGASLIFSLYYRAAPALGTRVPSSLAVLGYDFAPAAVLADAVPVALRPRPPAVDFAGGFPDADDSGHRKPPLSAVRCPERGSAPRPGGGGGALEISFGSVSRSVSVFPLCPGLPVHPFVSAGAVLRGRSPWCSPG